MSDATTPEPFDDLGISVNQETLDTDPYDHPATTPAKPAASFLRWVTVNNPFYLISAALVLYGLSVSFGDQTKVAHAWWFIGLLSGYTVLLTISATVIVRFGKVWNDARTILLVLLLLFLALSVHFDEVLIRDLQTGTCLIVFGFSLCVLITEGLLWGLQMRLPALFRIPYYLIFSLLFGYPLLLHQLLRMPISSTLANGLLITWGVFGFSVLAGICLVTLIPAVRRGQELLKANGTPWNWPLYPMSIFVFLVFGLGWRLHYLTIAFSVENVSIMFFYVPLLLGVCLVLLELAKALQSGVLTFVALSVPCGLLWMSIPYTHNDSISRHLLETVTAQIGSPLWMTSFALIGYYAYAWMRRISGAEWGFASAMLIGSLIAPETTIPSEIVLPQASCLLCLGFVQIGCLCFQFQLWRLMVVFGTLISAASCEFHDTWFTDYHGAIPLHLCWLSLLFLGALSQYPSARKIQVLAGIIGCLMFLVPWFATSPLQFEPVWWGSSYLLTMIMLCFGYWSLVLKRRCRIFLVAWMSQLTTGIALVGNDLLHAIDDETIAEGIPLIGGGLLLLVVALMVSFGKAGLIQPMLRRVKGWLLAS